jgi:hypothetical protein
MQQEILELSDKMKARLVELDKKSKTGHDYASQTLAYVYGDLGTVAAEIRINERERKNRGCDPCYSNRSTM